MVINNSEAANAAQQSCASVDSQNHLAHPSGIPQDQIDNIMSGIANTGDVKMNNHRKKLKQRFDIIKKLGQGTYGKVQLGINKETGQEVAIKTIKKCKIEAEADLVRIRREVQIMSSVQHPNIIHIYEVFENREKMVLVMEFAAGGELYDYLSERKVLSEEEARRIFRQVATAVYYCHKHKICHRDLKLENILLDEHGNAKIADFGLSNVFDEHRLLATFCGSPLYASPEIVEGTPYQGPEVDCWSLGVLLYTLVYGSMPFDGSNFKRLVKQISTGDYYEPKQPSRASTLIRAMLTACPRKRATIEQICSHWWVNENDNISCLDLAEDLANQTPVRLDVLLSVTPTAITAEQLVVPSADGKPAERIARSHSVGSIRDITAATTEAEQRIIDMVAAGGEAALMPSPTRTITPAQSPVQSKRKLETTISTENAVGAVKKKEKPGSSLRIDQLAAQVEETPMETDDLQDKTRSDTTTPSNQTLAPDQYEKIADSCDQLLESKLEDNNQKAGSEKQATAASVARQKTANKLDAVAEAAEKEEKEATKVIKKFVNKHKTADLVNAIGQSAAATTPSATQDTAAQGNKNTAATAMPPPPAAPAFVRKCSLQDESTLSKFNNERRKSRILETAEKFQQMNATSAANNNAPTNSNVATGNEKPKKIVIPGVSVGSFKKEFERKATAPTNKTEGLTPGEKRALEEVAAAQAAAAAAEAETEAEAQSREQPTAIKTANIAAVTPPSPSDQNAVENSDSKTSVSSLSLEDARRSMENSIALLRQAQNESSKEVDQLCAKTADIGVSTDATERERKLKAARSIIGNAIQPVIRRPPIPLLFGIGGGGYGSVRDDSGIYINGNKNTHSDLTTKTLGNKYNSVTLGSINAFNNNPYNKHKQFHQQQQQLQNTCTPYSVRSTSTIEQTTHSQPTTPQTATAPSPLPPATALAQRPQAAASVSNMALAAARQTIVERLAAGGIGMTTMPAATTAKAAPAFKPFNAFIQTQPQATTPAGTAPGSRAGVGAVASSGSGVGDGVYRFNSYSSSFLSQPPQMQQQLQEYQEQQMQHKRFPFTTNQNYINKDNNNNLFISTLPHNQLPQQQQLQQQRLMPLYRNATANPNAGIAINPKTNNTNATAATPIINAAAANANANQLINNQTIGCKNSATANSTPKPFYNAQPYPQIQYQNQNQNQNPMASLASTPDAETVKTSSASITLKSATLPRRKPGAGGVGNKTEIQLEIKPRIVEQPSMRFTTEMQHPVADLRSAPPREGPVPYSPIKQINTRAASLEPKEHIIPIQRPPVYARTTSNTTTRSGSLSRQSTVDSEPESTATTTNLSHSTIGGGASGVSSQPIKKSPREFIIPIAVEGGGFITPREGSIEPSDSTHTTSTAGTAASSRSTFSRLRPTRRIGSLLSDTGIDDNSPFQKIRTASQISRGGDGIGDDDGRFALHRLRSSRPVKKISQDNDDESSNEEDDDDGFEILTAESLFSTLLQRVRALTNRFNVNNEFAAGFPNSSRLLGNMAHRQSPFWNQEPFGSHHSNASTNLSGVPWRHSMSRDLGRDMESMFSRTGATLPRGEYHRLKSKFLDH